MQNAPNITPPFDDFPYGGIDILAHLRYQNFSKRPSRDPHAMEPSLFRRRLLGQFLGHAHVVLR